MAEIRWDAGQVRRLEFDLGKAPERMLARARTVIHKGAFDIDADGKIFCPVDTGYLRSSIGVDMGADGLSATIGPTANYGAYVELGVPHPYVIHARPGGFLRFTVGGRVVYARQVTHPPSAPRPYMQPAFDKNEPAIRDALGKAGEESVL